MPDGTCSNPQVYKIFFNVKSFTQAEMEYLYFILQKDPRFSQSHFVFTDVFSVYEVFVVMRLNVENYSFRLKWKTNSKVVEICFSYYVWWSV